MNNSKSNNNIIKLIKDESKVNIISIKSPDLPQKNKSDIIKKKEKQIINHINVGYFKNKQNEEVSSNLFVRRKNLLNSLHNNTVF